MCHESDAQNRTGKVILEKRALRKRMKEILRRRVTPALRADAAQEALSRFRALDVYRASGVVFSYMALPLEADTAPIHEAALRDGKVLALPKTQAQGGMTYHLIDSSKALETQVAAGAFGILEPLASCLPVGENLENLSLPEGEGILALIPGLAFSPEGHRLGRGAGFYDRFIPRLRQAAHGRFPLCVAGLCFPFQILSQVPADKTDAKMDIVV
jgi:5-formyltetrahydrofolate cyclo-ligase